VSVRCAVSATLGNLRYDAQVGWCTADLAALPDVDVCRVALPVAVRFEAAPGDAASVDLTGLDLAGASGPARVVTGQVWRVQSGPQWTVVEVVDAGASLAAARPAATRSAGTAGDAVSALCSDAGVDAGEVDLDLPLPSYVVDQGRTAAEHVAYLARLGGAFATVDASGAVRVVPAPDQPDTALRYGRELLDYRVSGYAPPAQVIAVGAGPAGSVEAPDALRVSTDPLPGDAPDPGPQVVWRASPVLRTPGAASAASDAAAAFDAARGHRFAARCLLLPSLRPGAVVQVQDVPGAGADGAWLVTRVHHRVGGSAGLTELSAVDAGAGAAAGGLLGAVAGLL
jgi:hypothetical protein